MTDLLLLSFSPHSDHRGAMNSAVNSSVSTSERDWTISQEGVCVCALWALAVVLLELHNVLQKNTLIWKFSGQVLMLWCLYGPRGGHGPLESSSLTSVTLNDTIMSKDGWVCYGEWPGQSFKVCVQFINNLCVAAKWLIYKIWMNHWVSVINRKELH